MTYNVRSFHANIDSFLSIFDDVSLPDILVLTETWFAPDTSCDIPWFCSYHTYRIVGRSEGVLIFVTNNLFSYMFPDLCISDINIEVCTITVRVSNSSFIILGIYRPHSGTIENFIASLNYQEVSNKPILLLEDLNIIILNGNLQAEICMNHLG